MYLFSTTSTLSAGSTGSQARLIQSSHQPENYHPIQVEELGKHSTNSTTRTVKADVHVVKSKSPNRSPNQQSPTRKDPSPNRSRKSSPSTGVSPRTSRSNSRSSSKDENGPKSPKKIKSSLKQPSRSLSIENPTCVECYLSSKTDKG